MSVERLTAKHFKDSDGYYMRCSGTCSEGCCDGCGQGDEFVDRMGQIEDILGEDYDLDRLRELVEADKAGRCIIFKKGYPVVSEYQPKNEDGLYIKTVTGVISKEDYESAIK